MKWLWLLLAAIVLGEAVANLSLGDFDVAFWQFWGAYWLLEVRRAEGAK